MRLERDRHRRLQKRTGQGVEEVDAAQGTMRGEDVSGVEQCPQACRDVWRSYIFLAKFRYRSYRSQIITTTANVRDSMRVTAGVLTILVQG